jgi:hypothetical protein
MGRVAGWQDWAPSSMSELKAFVRRVEVACRHVCIQYVMLYTRTMAQLWALVKELCMQYLVIAYYWLDCSVWIQYLLGRFCPDAPALTL